MLMIPLEIRRFLRRGYLAAIVSGIILAIGFSGAAVTINIVRALSRSQNAGLENGSFATIAQQTSAGGLSRINWLTVEQLRNIVRLPNSRMSAYAPSIHHILQWHNRSIQVSIALTERGFFSEFARHLYAGNDFTPDLGSGGDEGEAIISEELSRNLFGSANAALHQEIRIANHRFTIVGIAPKEFRGLWTPTDVWTTPNQWGRLGSDSGETHLDSWKIAAIWYYLVVASPGVRPEPYQTLETQLHSKNNQPLHLLAVAGLTNDPIRDRTIYDSSRLGFLVAMALLVSASLNYCILLLARSAQLVEEFRLKRILGAGPSRLALDASVGPFFVVFAGFLLSGIITVLVQHFLAMREINPLIASGFGIYSVVSVLALEFPLACVLGASVALVPTLSLLRESGPPKMGSTATQTKRERLILNSIVVIEITICTIAFLFASSFVQQYYIRSKIDLGFDPQQLASYEVNRIKGSGTITISTSSGHDSPFEALIRLTMIEAREQLPGLKSIASSSCAPFGPPMKTVDIYRFQTGTEPLKAISFCTVSQDFFSTTRTRIDRGSGFSEGDFHGDVAQALVNKSLAKVLGPIMNQTLRLDMPASNFQLDVNVKGIVDDTRQEGALSSPQPTVYLPLTGNAMIMSFPLYFVARGQQSTERFSEIFNRQSEKTVRHLGIVRSYSVEEMIRLSLQEQNQRLKIALIGAVFIAFIAYAGLYGVLVHSVAVRQKELALRMTFGASSWTLQRITIEKTLQCCFVAIFLSLLLWRACLGLIDSRWMAGSSWSWISVSVASLLCGFVSTVISLVTAKQAIRLTPASLLRNE